jgi:hypothetical protein
MNTRSLKIEMAGDSFRQKTFPKIRLQGQWLARLGFPAGSRVAVVPMATGEIMLRVETANEADARLAANLVTMVA